MYSESPIKVSYLAVRGFRENRSRVFYGGCVVTEALSGCDPLGTSSILVNHPKLRQKYRVCVLAISEYSSVRSECPVWGGKAVGSNPTIRTKTNILVVADI